MTGARNSGGWTISSATLTVIGFALTALNSFFLFQRDDQKEMQRQIQGNTVAIAQLHGEISGLEQQIQWLRQEKGGEGK